MPGTTEHRQWREREHHRRAHHKPRAVEGGIGHWVREAGVLSPLIISEFVEDPAKKMRFVRITSIAAAIILEGLHSHKAYKDRERDREALEACMMPCAGIT